MKKHLITYLIAITTYFLTMHASALESDFLPDLKEGIASIRIQEPARDVGYTVGDVLTREISVTIKKPYVLVEESLPIVGYERRHKGQLIGIDLSHLKHTKEEGNGEVKHNISLSYQIFTTNVVAKPAALPAEFLRVLNTSSKKNEVFRYRIPSWNFAISPLSVFGQVKVEADMSGYRGPLLLDATPQKTKLKILLPILGLSILGLLYMLGQHAWLPRMGGPFALAYKAIRKSPKTHDGLQNVVERMHKALNKSAGYSLFSHNLDDFFNHKPAFKHIQSELGQFFNLSNAVFFEPNRLSKDHAQSIQWLEAFCKQCRDCERGLIPDSIATLQQG